MSLYRSPFNLISDLTTVPFGTDVYVVSESKYKELRQKQAQDEISVLEKRAAHYDECAVRIRETISELKQEFDLLSEASED